MLKFWSYEKITSFKGFIEKETNRHDMKLRTLTLLFFAILFYVLFSSARLGVASQYSLDRTGSPLSNGLHCGQCHSGAINNAALSVVLKDENNQAVTTYTPGSTYSIEANVSSNFGSERGFQLVGLTISNVQAGNFSLPGGNTKITSIEGREYLEHSVPVFTSSSSIFSASWTARASNAGPVTFYSAGIAGNGNNAISGDDPISPIQLTVSEAVIVPVKLTSFQASREENGISIKWETAMEESFDNFEIESSDDGVMFSKIETIFSTGNDSKYQYIDPLPESESIYYRLRLNDLNGSFQYSKVIYVDADRSVKELTIFPNPTSGNAWIELPRNDRNYHISWHDINGLLIGSITTKEDRIQLPFESLNSGIYLLSISDEAHSYLRTTRIIKL